MNSSQVALTGEQNHDSPDHVFPDQLEAILVDRGADVLIPGDVDGDVTLNRMSEEDGDGQEDLHRFAQLLLGGQAERDTALDVAAITYVSEESHGGIHHYYDNHGGVENAERLHEGFRCLHLILQRHDLRTNHARA